MPHVCLYSLILLANFEVPDCFNFLYLLVYSALTYSYCSYLPHHYLNSPLSKMSLSFNCHFSIVLSIFLTTYFVIFPFVLVRVRPEILSWKKISFYLVYTFPISLFFVSSSEKMQKRVVTLIVLFLLVLLLFLSQQTRFPNIIYFWLGYYSR